MTNRESAANDADYAKWDALLRGERPELYEDTPEPGFYRSRQFQNGPLVGVAIWREGDQTIVVRAGNLVKGEDVWPNCARSPITETYYRTWMQSGVWPDEHVLPPSDGPGMARRGQARLGRARQGAVWPENEPRDPGEFETLADQIESAKAGVAEYTEIADDDTARRAQSLRARLNELSRTADNRRQILKKPHLEAGQAVDHKWQPLVKDAKDGAETLASRLSAYATRQARAVEEARRIAEAEQKRAENEARRARESGQESREEPPASPPELPRVATTIRGAYGRAASVRLVRVAIIRDIDEAFQYFRKDELVIEAILLAAQRQVNAGVTPPGIEVEEERRVS
jgi:hypothetical protein